MVVGNNNNQQGHHHAERGGHGRLKNTPTRQGE